MTYKRNIPALLASLLLGAGAGCLGGELTLDNDPPDPVSGGNAKAQFESTVAPILNASCGTTGCHEGTGSPSKFLGQPGPTDDYDAMVGQTVAHSGFDSTNAAILTKIALGNHYDKSYSDGQRDAIVAWLDAEKLAAGGENGGGPVQVSGDPLAAWAGCMTIGNWNASNMGEWSNKQTNGDGPCENCHNDGLARFFTNNNNNEMYNQNRTQLGIISFFTVATDDRGDMTVEMAIDKVYRMGSGATLHPLYNVNENDIYFEYLAEFTELTRQTMAEGDCLAPGYYPEP